MDNPYIGTLAFCVHQIVCIAIGLGARYPEHIAEGAEDHTGSRSDFDGPVDCFGGGHTDRASRAVDDAQVWGEKLIDSVAQDRVGLSTADFHEGQRPSRLGVDLADQGFDVDWISEIGRLHSVIPSGSERSSRGFL